MKAKLSTLVGLPREERRILRQAWLSLLLAYVSLRISSLPKTQRLLAPRVLAPRARMDAAAGGWRTTPSRLVRLVEAAARHHVWPMGCLQKSLVLQALLHRQGVAADLQIGVRKHAGRLKAHAWLETAGQPLFEAPEVGRDFQPLLPLGSAS